MSIIVFLKILSDLCIFLTFAGLFASLGGATVHIMVIALAIDVLCVTVSYMLSGRGKIRYLPLVLTLAGFLLPGAGIADFIVMILAIGYSVWVSAKKIYVPEWDIQVQIFSVFWKVFFTFVVIALICSQSAVIRSLVIPCGIVAMAACILLTRSLRHDPEVYCSRRYQAVNLLFLLVVGVVAAFLSSNMFLNGAVAAFKAIYEYVISPILMVAIYAIVIVIRVIGWLFSFIKINLSGDGEVQELNLGNGAEDIFGEEASEMGGDNVTFNRVMLALGIILAVVLAVLLLRFLMRRSGKNANTDTAAYRRTAAEEAPPADREPEEGTPVQRIRTLYRRFLKLCVNDGIKIDKSDTSLDVNNKCSEELDEKSTAELRDIYLAARYNGEASKDDVAKARELYSEIKKSSE